MMRTTQYLHVFVCRLLYNVRNSSVPKQVHVRNIKPDKDSELATPATAKAARIRVTATTAFTKTIDERSADCAHVRVRVYLCVSRVNVCVRVNLVCKQASD